VASSGDDARSASRGEHVDRLESAAKPHGCTVTGMLALTDAAAAAINALVESGDLEHGGLRIASTGEEDAVELAIVAGPSEGDRIVVVQGASVFVDPALERELDETVLDAILDEDGVHFGLVGHDEAGDHHHL
jgi:Fe-S cluster assembly iron-binding protein IscA